MPADSDFVTIHRAGLAPPPSSTQEWTTGIPKVRVAGAFMGFVQPVCHFEMMTISVSSPEAIWSMSLDRWVFAWKRLMVCMVMPRFE